MKKVILSVFVAAVAMQASAQVVTDTVSIGAGYANQVWYSLPNDEQGSSPENNWDIAFDASGMGASVMINSAKSTTLWKYPHSDTAGWSTLDTTGLSTWTAHYNSDTSWALGAMGNYADASNPYDLDWGLYNITTHVVTGDSLYVIKLADNTYRKLWIKSLSGSVYTFEYANLDGTGDHTATLSKSSYTGKNFGYYSLQNNAAIDREPLSANWDLTFTQYTGFVPIAYTVTGVLSNTGVQVAKCSAVANVTTFTDYASATFSSQINTIGYDWKSFTGGAYVTKDSLCYFVRTAPGNIWKMIFTGFGGSSTGNYIFSKEKLYTSTSVQAVNGTPVASMALYPNPSNGQNVTVVYSFEQAVPAAMLTITDMAGRTVAHTTLDNAAGLHQHSVQTQQLVPGMYLVDILAGDNHVQQKLIVQ